MSFGRIQRGSRQSLFWRRWHEDQRPVVPLQWGSRLPGTNRFHARPSPVLVLAKARESSLRVSPCVFVSHQYADLQIAVRVAELLKELWVNAWLAVDDPATQQAVRSGDRVKLASSIDWCLTNCTHLLAIITPRTKGSWWAPYEIGAATRRISIRGLPRSLPIVPLQKPQQRCTNRSRFREILSPDCFLLFEDRHLCPALLYFSAFLTQEPVGSLNRLLTL